MRFITERMNVEVKYKKVSVNQLVPRPQLVMRHEGKLVESKRVTGNGEVLETFHWKHFREDGTEVSRKDVQYFQVKEDGTEQPVRPFSRTKEIKIVKEVPAASMSGFLVTSYYELFHKDESIISALYEEAERYFKKDLVGIALFSWGNGFLQYYAIVYPILREGKFVWVMSLTQTKIIYSHLMEVPAQKEPVEQPPTLEALPPVEAIITA